MDNRIIMDKFKKIINSADILQKKFTSSSALTIYMVIYGNITITYNNTENIVEHQNISTKQFCLVHPNCKYKLKIDKGTNYVMLSLKNNNNSEKNIMNILSQSQLLNSLPHFNQFLELFRDILILNDSQNVEFSVNRFEYYKNQSNKDVFLPAVFFVDLLKLTIEILKCLRNSLVIADKNIYLRKAMAYINTYFYNKISIKDIANYVGISTTYLENLFKKEMQCTIYEFVNKIRVNRSVILLTNSTVPISKIYKNVGFSTQQAYINNFKKYKKILPSDLRKQQ